jgi:hypothetical protein
MSIYPCRENDQMGINSFKGRHVAPVALFFLLFIVYPLLEHEQSNGKIDISYSYSDLRKTFHRIVQMGKTNLSRLTHRQAS